MKAKAKPISSASAASDSGKTGKSETIKEITLYDSGEEVVELDEEIKVTKAKENEKEKPKARPNSDILRKHFLNNSLLRGLLPRETEESYQRILSYPVVKRCCIEHCYFVRNRSGTFRYNLRSCSANDPNTLPFENANEHEHEQETIDFECLGSKDIDSTPTNNTFNGNIKVYSKKKRSSISSCSGSSGVTEGSAADDSNSHERLVKRPTATVSKNLSVASVGSGDSTVRVFSGSGTSLSKPVLKLVKSVPSDDRKKNASRHRLEIKSYPITNKTPNNFVSVHDLITKFRTMQKLMRVRCDRRLSVDSGKSSKIQPIKIKKLAITRGKGEDLVEIPECVYPVSNLTKMADGEDKNWRVEYMDDDVQNFALDDLLLKASELNAENFTKALGRKVDSVNSGDFNGKDSSEIVFTIPKSKRNSVDEKQCYEKAEREFSVNSNVKSIKLDISKPFFDSGEVKEQEKTQEVAKPPEEASPKRPGIKVKTVENINEEFKDALSLKKLLHEESSNDTSKELVAVPESKRILPSSSLGKRILLDKGEQEGSSRRNSIENNKAEESRPFIMTIIQSKNEKQRPAILRNSSYFKKKVNSAENGKSLEKNDEGLNNGEKQQTESNSVNSIGNGKVEESAKIVPESQDSSSKALENTTSLNLNKNDGSAQSSLAKRNPENSSYGKVLEGLSLLKLYEAKRGVEVVNNDRFALKKRNIPFILSQNKKHRVQESSQGNGLGNAQVITVSPSNKLVKVNEGPEKLLGSEKTFKVTSIEQKLGPKEMHRRFIKVVPYEPAKQLGKKIETGGKIGGSTNNNNNSTSEPPAKQHVQNEEADEPTTVEGKNGHVLSLGAFASILKDILPDKWFLFLDKKYGLQIVKTHVDKLLNPSLMLSVVIARCGKVTVNVRGRQLQQSHELFSNLCDMGNSENKLSLNYVLALLNKLTFLGVCYGCDDQSLRKYWCKDGFVEYQTESHQVYRSHLCHMLVSFGRKRCYPCCRMTEALRKRYRREKLSEMSKDTSKDLNPKMISDVEELENSSKVNLHPRGVKRNLEDFLEESFSTMKKQISDELEKNKKLGERENALKAQEEVLSFMGLTRKDSLDNPVRKSKRKKTSFYSQQPQQQQPVKKKIDQQELEFLEKYWPDIYTLFSTSLLFGAYSRTGRSRLRENCRLFQKLLSTWRNIARTDPEWIGGEITLPEHLFGDPLADDSGCDQFEKMEVPALRNYIINSVKEVNRIKYKLRTRNSYFKILYNKFVKRRMKRPKSASPSSDKKSTPVSSNNNSAANTPTPTDFSSDESSRDKGKMTDDESQPAADSANACVPPDGD